MSNDPKEVVNGVRSVLVHEFGLTRESVREVMLEMVNETIQRKLNSIEFDKKLEDLVHFEMIKLENTALSEGRRFNPTTIRTILIDIAKEQMAQFVKEKIKIEGI